MAVASGGTHTFTDPRLCAAIVDRLTFAGNIIETGTTSYRFAHARAQGRPRMRLRSRAGEDTVELTVLGYVFPDAEDPQKRFSWHRVRGSATRQGHHWEFGFPALSCDETPRISAWFREVADLVDRAEAAWPGRLSFTEPNIAVEASAQPDGGISLRMFLSQEFREPLGNPPSSESGRSTGSYPEDNPPWLETLIELVVNPADLRAAADTWDAETAPFPDGPY